MPTIYFVRHGQTEWNAAGRFQGSQDIPLNDIGKGQAVRSGELLTDILANDSHDLAKMPFVSSPLGRARNTMELLRGALGVPPHGYELDDRLREIGYGHWEGSTLAQMEVSHPELFAERQADKWGVPPPGGESYASVTIRVRDWYDSLLQDTVTVSHGGTMRALMVALDVETPVSAVDTLVEQGVVYVFRGGQVTKHS
ncbi:histidine phosphatase family protein [Bradyrhizobium sp. SYSU BS000235]|uniref:histidine phosphatase family protein n=1 Tax=Bradyrhizobium sp. SYSU BS000235 TaxID=3411332 RepID=UPI003C72FB20